MNHIETLVKQKKEKLNAILPKLDALKSKPSDRLISQEKIGVDALFNQTPFNQNPFNQFNDGWNNYGR